MVRQRILEGARKWIGPWEGLVFIRLRRKRWYFIFCLTNPPDRQISSHRTTTTFCPFSSSFANIDANRPNMWWRASTTTRRAQIPEPDTIFLSPPPPLPTSVVIYVEKMIWRVCARVCCLYIKGIVSVLGLRLSGGLGLIGPISSLIVSWGYCRCYWPVPYWAYLTGPTKIGKSWSPYLTMK